MTTDAPAVIDITVRDEHTQTYRFRYTRRSDAPGYWRTDYEWVNFTWQLAGRSAILDLSTEFGDGLALASGTTVV